MYPSIRETGSIFIPIRSLYHLYPLYHLFLMFQLFPMYHLFCRKHIGDENLEVIPIACALLGADFVGFEQLFKFSVASSGRFGRGWVRS